MHFRVQLYDYEQLHEKENSSAVSKDLIYVRDR